MSTYPASIESLVCQLREQNDLPLWAVASSSTISAIASGAPEAYGPRGRWINVLFETTGVTWLGLQALRLFTFGVVTFWWVQSLRQTRCKKLPVELFIGFGAGPEQQMFDAFQEEGERTVERLDQTKPATFAYIVRPSVSTLWRHAWNEPKLILNGLRRSEVLVIKEHAHEWLTSIAIRIGTYVFYKAWAERLPVDVRRVVFISPDIPAFAVIDAHKLNPNINIEFRQHGLLRKSVVLPTFNKVLALNKPEADHIRVTTGCEQVETLEIRFEERPFERRSVLLFASIYDFPGFKKEEHVDLIRGVVEWATDNNLRMVIRLHPCEIDGFWPTHFPAVEIDREDDRFGECLKRFSPMFVMSWFSTALIDALKVGILPVLITPGSEKALADIVFPLDEIAVKWPKEQTLLEDLLRDQGMYRNRLRFLQQEAFGAVGCNDCIQL